MSSCKPFWKVIFLTLVMGLGSQVSLGDVFTFKGLERTNESWIREYLVLDSDKAYTDIELDQLRVKLLTAGVFTSVEVIRNGPEITVSVEEKWTTIPVARGEFGGGTPLRVFGIYDIHTWGRLVTAGAELRQYGTSDPGFVTWMKAPRFKDGRYTLGVELWKDVRRRNIYDDDRRLLGEVEEKNRRVRLQYLGPLSALRILSDRPGWQVGADAHVLRTEPTAFEANSKLDSNSEAPNLPFTFSSEPKWKTKFFLTTVYDDIAVNQYDLDGMRQIFCFGKDSTNGLIWDFEVFAYELKGDINFSAHIYAQNRIGKDLSSQRFLGGFDGVRGVLDGIQVGPKSWQLNQELKVNVLRTKNVWLMGAGFFDLGKASDTWNVKNPLSSLGMGLRIASPKVYRLMLRIDHGWAIDGSKQKGFSIGLNDFFQPYRPLQH
jgi:hypothetical protein